MSQAPIIFNREYFEVGGIYSATSDYENLSNVTCKEVTDEKIVFETPFGDMPLTPSMVYSHNFKFEKIHPGNPNVPVLSFGNMSEEDRQAILDILKKNHMAEIGPGDPGYHDPTPIPYTRPEIISASEVERMNQRMKEDAQSWVDMERRYFENNSVPEIPSNHILEIDCTSPDLPTSVKEMIDNKAQRYKEMVNRCKSESSEKAGNVIEIAGRYRRDAKEAISEMLNKKGDGEDGV